MRVSCCARAVAAVAAVAGLRCGASAAEPAVGDALATLRAVSKEGAGNEAAAAAWKQVVAAGPAGLVPTLFAFDGASPQAANWLRSAVDAVAEAERKAKRPLPAADLEAFLKDTRRSPAARWIAYELFAGENSEAAGKLLPTLVDDPSRDIRRAAVAVRIKFVDVLGSNSGEREKAELRTLFAAARDQDQVEEIAKLLEKHGDPKPNLTEHFGVVTEWQIALPFDGPMASGFGKSYPPEQGVDLSAKYPGKGGADVTWRYAQSGVTFGQLDLNALFGKHKDAVAYAYAVVVSEKETPAEVRLSSANAVQVFLNGTKVFEREEYHHGAPFDQYVARGTLKPGRNEILLKLCQNDQKDSWAQAWFFAARLCDPTGGKLPVKQVVVKDGKESTVPLGRLGPPPKTDDPKGGK